MRWLVACRDVLWTCTAHGVLDGDATCLDPVGQELVEFTVQIQCGNPQQGREELCPDCHLQQGEVRGRVRSHTLHVLPLILQTEGKSGVVDSLWIVAGQQSQHLYCGNPCGYHVAKPVSSLISEVKQMREL